MNVWLYKTWNILAPNAQWTALAGAENMEAENVLSEPASIDHRPAALTKQNLSREEV